MSVDTGLELEILQELDFETEYVLKELIEERAEPFTEDEWKLAQEIVRLRRQI